MVLVVLMVFARPYATFYIRNAHHVDSPAYLYNAIYRQQYVTRSYSIYDSFSNVNFLHYSKKLPMKCIKP